MHDDLRAFPGGAGNAQANVMSRSRNQHNFCPSVALEYSFLQEAQFRSTLKENQEQYPHAKEN